MAQRYPFWHKGWSIDRKEGCFVVDFKQVQKGVFSCKITLVNNGQTLEIYKSGLINKCSKKLALLHVANFRKMYHKSINQ